MSISAIKVALAILLAKPLMAQPSILDPNLALGDRYQKAADIASWITVGTAVGLDVADTINSHCGNGNQDCTKSLGLVALRVGATAGASELLKRITNRKRPCYPCSEGNKSFPSGHTAFGFMAVSGPRLAITLPLAISTGGLRVAANRHWLTDTLAGAGIGLLTSRIRMN